MSAKFYFGVNEETCLIILFYFILIMWEWACVSGHHSKNSGLNNIFGGVCGIDLEANYSYASK